MKTKKAGHFKLLSFLLSVTLLVGFVPTAAFAAADEAQWSTDGGTTTTTGTLAEALAAVQKDNVGGSITLLADVNTEAVGKGRTYFNGVAVTLDLNGKKWTAKDSQLAKSAALTIKDSAVGGGGEFIGTNSHTVNVTDGSSFVLESGTVTNTSSRNYAISGKNGTTVTIKGGTARQTLGGYAVSNEGSFIMSGGSVESNDAVTFLNAVDKAGNIGEARISGGTIKSPSRAAFKNVGTMTIDGGTFLSMEGRPSYQTKNEGTLTINGGTFLPTDTIERTCQIWNTKTIIINGGNIGTIQNGGTVKNTAGDDLTVTVLSLKDVAAETAVTALAFDPEYTYGLKDVTTTSAGTLNAWLPATQADAKATLSAGGKTYSGTIAVGKAELTEKYALTVTDGTGGGSFAKDEVVTITANTPEAGKVFDTWTTTDGVEFADATSATTTITMPEEAVTVVATYKAAEPTKYALTVTGGTGSGSFEENAKVTITANAPEAGKKFDKWTSADGVTFANASAATTTITMPAQAATVTANWIADEPVTPPTPTPPVIIDGKDQVIEQGKPATFRSDAALKDFQKVLVDGNEISSSNYTLKEGSTIVTLNADYMKTLSAGKHTLSIVSTTGSADAGFTVSKSAAAAGNTDATDKKVKPTSLDKKLIKTGDSTLNLGLFAGVLVVAAGGALALSLNLRKSEK